MRLWGKGNLTPLGADRRKAHDRSPETLSRVPAAPGMANFALRFTGAKAGSQPAAAGPGAPPPSPLVLSEL